MGSVETYHALRESLRLSGELEAHRAGCRVRGCGRCAELDAAVSAVWKRWASVKLDFRAPPGMDALF